MVAAAEAERDGAEHSLQLQIAAEYWDTVEAYVAQMLA